MIEADWLERLDEALAAVIGPIGFEIDEVVELRWRRRVIARQDSLCCTFDVIYNGHGLITSIEQVGAAGSLERGLWERMVMTLTTDEVNRLVTAATTTVVYEDECPVDIPQARLLYRVLASELRRRGIGIRNVLHKRGDHYERYHLGRSGKEGDALYYYDRHGRFNRQVKVAKCADAHLRLDIEAASATALEQLISDEF